METKITTTIKQSPGVKIDDHHSQLSLFIDEDDDHQLDSLSLRDLPLTAAVDDTTPPENNHSRQSSASSDPTSDFFFEFLINNDDDLITSTADDVIFHGRLLPFAPPPHRRSLSLSSAAARLTRPQLTDSLPAIRPSRSLNYRKLRHCDRSKSKFDFLHKKSISSNNNNSDKIPSKFPWYWLVFGFPVKNAAEMEMKDIKNRQFRKECAPPKRVFSGDRSCSSASWKVLSVLSCKRDATVDVNHTALLPASP